MKYGETLRQRSIPAWAHYNVDYDEIKRVIKEHTTPGNGKAVSIPGQGNPVERGFEKELLTLFELEQRRVDLFVKTKSGEIDRRLKHLGQQIGRLAERERTRDRTRTRTPAKRLELYARLEDDVLKIGQELNSLSRYLNAQRTAFQKLLKKYKKWTRDDNLQETVKQTLMNQPGTFWKADVRPMFDRYTELLQIIRTALEPASIVGNNGPPRNKSQKMSESRNKTGAAISVISKTVESNAELDFDVSLVTTPYGDKGGKAVYWVNPESTIELQVLLLRYMRLLIPQAKTKSSPFSSVPQSPTDSQSRRISVPGIDGDEKDDLVGTLVVDNAERYARQEIGKTVEDNEGTTGCLPSKSLGQVLWSSAGEAVVKAGLNAPGEEAIRTARLKRKHLPAVLDTSRPFIRRPSYATLNNNQDAASETKDESINDVRQWLTLQKNVSTIAGHCSKRTRYVGLTNNSSRAMWASLDKNICFKRNMLQNLEDNDWSSRTCEDSTEFPHHVLQLRYEGFESAELVAALDKSHLTERIRGFSLETHAVWHCCEPKSMPPPLWLSIVDQPISNVPEEEKRRPRRMGSLAGSSDLSNQERASISATSNDNTTASTPLTAGAETSNTSAPDQLEAPALSVFKKKRRRGYPSRVTTFASQSKHEEPGAGYWNEYDHPEDGSNEDVFVIYIDPNAPTFPGEELFWHACSKVKGFFQRSRPTDEEAPLLRSPISSTRAEESSESSDEEDNVGSFDPRSNRYGTMAAPLNLNSAKPLHKSILPNLWPFSDEASQHPSSLRFDNPAEIFAAAEARYREREKQKFQLYITSLGAAVTILAILVILSLTSRHRYRGEVDASLVVGIVANLMFAFTGVGYMISRQDQLSWSHRGAVGAVFVGVCVFDGMLLTWALS